MFLFAKTAVVALAVILPTSVSATTYYCAWAQLVFKIDYEPGSKTIKKDGDEFAVQETKSMIGDSNVLFFTERRGNALWLYELNGADTETAALTTSWVTLGFLGGQTSTQSGRCLLALK